MDTWIIWKICWKIGHSNLGYRFFHHLWITRLKLWISAFICGEISLISAESVHFPVNAPPSFGLKILSPLYIAGTNFPWINIRIYSIFLQISPQSILDGISSSSPISMGTNWMTHRMCVFFSCLLAFSTYPQHTTTITESIIHIIYMVENNGGIHLIQLYKINLQKSLILTCKSCTI